MDTFSHIIIGFLIFAKYDLRLAFIAGFMAMFVDLDILIYPLGLKFPIFEHRGIVHAIPIAIVYTAIVAFVFMFLTKLNYALILIAGLTGSLLHIFCDTLTNYGTYSLYPIVKKHIKLNIIYGVDPATIFISIPSLIYLYYFYITANFVAFYYLCTLISIVFVSYFLIHIILKLIVTIKFKKETLPTFSRITFKIIDVKYLVSGNEKYKLLKWRNYNIITRHLSSEKSFKLPLYEVNPPLNSEDEMIAYSYELKGVKKTFNRLDYIVCKIKGKQDNWTDIFWYSLELNSKKFNMGIDVILKKDGNYKIKRYYPIIGKTNLFFKKI
ncbi:MAG: metal-dependent hydrolase [Candidatus Helarchaeota archaeon]